MTLTFASPEWLWCLLLLLPLALLRFWSQVRGAKGAPGLVSPRLVSDLIVGAAQWKRWVIFSIQLAALALLLVALARPQWGYEEAKTESKGRNVFVAIDTSRSMLARDLLPDRITRAKLAAQDIVDALPADRIGLIAFAGRAFLQAPLTVDHDAVLETIQQFDTELVPRGGTNLASAVTLAIETLEKAGSLESALVLFSDGENLEGEEELKQLRDRAEKVGLVLVAIGVGTEIGELIPELDDKGRPKPGVFVKDDENSSVVRSRLNPAALKDLSRQIGGGVYVNLGATASISEVVEESIEQIEGVRAKGESRRQPIERFMWPLGASMVLFLLAWIMPGTLRVMVQIFGKSRSRATPSPLPARRSRSRAASGALALVLIIPGMTSAQNASKAARESPAFAALQRNSYDTAVEAYEREVANKDLKPEELAWLNLGLGSAAYKSGDYEKAKLAFGKALEYRVDPRIETKAHHNLGNALFRTGEKLLGGPGSSNPDLPQLDQSAQKELVAEQWRGAIEHYQAALKADAGNQPSRHNLSVVQKRLELLMQKPPEEEEKKEDEKEDEEKQDQEKQEDQKSQGEDEKDEPRDPNQDPNDQPQDPNNPENAQDPKDPGDNEGKPDEPKDPSNQPPNDGNQPPKKPDQPPQPQEPPPEGKLEADRPPNEPQPGDQQPEPAKVNPETGFSPEEARQKLRTLSDEDLEVRPAIRVPIKAERFKNW